MKVVGTFIMDGLLQGRLPLDPEFEAKVRLWLADQHARGLHFDFAIDGGSFSLLPDDQPHASSAFPENVETYLSEGFQGFLALVPQSDAQLWMSTLRSVSYLADQEVQSLYVVAPPGKIELQTRTVDAKTVAAPEPLRMKKSHLVGIGLLLLLFLIAGSLVDWKALLHAQTDAPAPVLLDVLILNDAAFQGFIVFEKTSVDTRQHGLIVTARGGANWAHAVESIQPDVSSWKSFHAISSIKKGFARCEIYGAEDRLLLTSTLRLKALIDSAGEPVELLIPLPRERVHRVVIGPS